MIRINQGFTLIETMIAVSIMAIVATFAIPVLTSGLTNNSVKNASQQLLEEFSKARSQAISSNKTVEFSFTSGTNWCYGIDNDKSSGTACTCSATPSNCDKVISYSEFSDVTLANNLNDANSKIWFTPNRGRLDSNKATSGQVDFQRSGTTVSVKINILGKGSTCSPDIGGIGAC